MLLWVALPQESVLFPEGLRFIETLNFVSQACMLCLKFENFMHVKVRWLELNFTHLRLRLFNFIQLAHRW